MQTRQRSILKTVVARLDWHFFHRVRTPEIIVNRP